MRKGDKYTDEENQIIKDNLHMRFEDVSRLFLPHRTAMALQKHSANMGYESTYFTKHTKHEDFWEKINMLNSYWAGVLNSDGCLGYYRNSYYVGLGFAAKDLYHLEKFRHDVGADTVKIYERWKKSPHSDNITCHHSLRICDCKKWHQDLERNFGVVPQKTCRLGPPNMTSVKYKMAFLIGTIDGDGTLGVSKTQYDYNRINIGIVSCGIDYLKWFKETLEYYFPYKYNLDKDRRITDTGYENGKLKKAKHFGISGYAAGIIIDCLSKIDCIPKLDRKWKNPRLWEVIDKYKKNRPELFENNTPENLIDWNKTYN